MISKVFVIISILFLLFIVFQYINHRKFIKYHNDFLDKKKKEHEAYLKKINEYIKNNTQ